MATSRSTTTAKKAVTGKPAVKKSTPVTTKTSTTKSAPKALTGKTPTAKKPAAIVKKAATPLSKPATTPAVKTPAARTKDSPAAARMPTAEQRYKMVQEAAYFIAEKDGFHKDAREYWTAAETQIEALLSGKKKK